VRPPIRDVMRFRCPLCGHRIAVLAFHTSSGSTLHVSVRIIRRSLRHLRTHGQTVQRQYRRRQLARRRRNRHR
jgi:hypothetical protein